ncbi:MAG: AzlC family ABC transporter permease [Rubrobacteraceae bacterium]|nr:AzlC family ABC transporter permease [Rubrobacteraceae bacterium]
MCSRGAGHIGGGRRQTRPSGIARDLDEATPEASKASSSAAAFVAGAKAIVPVLLALIPFGVAFGATATESGLSAAEALGMSIFVFAGAAQLAALPLLSAGASVAVVVLTVLIVNLRLTLYSASMAPHFGRLPAGWKGILSYLLTDQKGVHVMTTTQAPDLTAIKGRQQKAWSSGDYGKVGATLTVIAELMAEAADLRPGERVLDVACGNGNTSLAAARRFCEVVGIDYVPMMLDEGRRRAEADGLAVDFRKGDAEDIPFPDASFDVVLSTIGVIFAPDQEKAAGELMRVCKPGGRIGMANWVPDGYVGDLFKTMGKYVPPPPGLKSPFRWGTQDGLRELFGDGMGSLQTRRRTFVWRFPSARYHVGFMRGYYGPLHKAFETLDESGQKALEEDLISLVENYNRSGNGTAVWPADYLEVVAARR